MLTMRMTPKMRERPLASRKRRAPYERPLKVWTIQKSGLTPALLQTQHAGGVRADDALLVLLAETDGLGLDDGERSLHAHVEAEVRAEHHAIRAHGGDQVAEGGGIMADDVVGEAAEIGAEGALRHALRLGPDALPVPEASVHVGHGAARMRQAHRELGETIEHAAEHQVRGSDGGVEGIAEKIAQVIGSESLATDHPQRMKEHGQAQGGRALEDAEERGI